MWTLQIIFFVHVVVTRCTAANPVSDQVFTENGLPFSTPEEDGLDDQMISADSWKNAPPYSPSDFSNEYEPPAENAEMGPQDAEMGIEPQDEEPRGPIRKREGQEEFATFVDQNRLLSKQGGFEKRARVESGKPGTDVRSLGDTVFIAVATVCTAATVFGLVAAAFVWRRIHLKHTAAQESEYPHYGITGPAKERSGNVSPVAAMDAKLASTAHLYHYQHTKQQILAMEQSTCESKGQDSEDSDVEEDEGDYSVYEYPGLASTGDIEVANPLFESVASPLTKTDPTSTKLQPSIHKRFSSAGEDQ